MNFKDDVKSFLKTVPTQPGVYQMFSDTGTVIYVGKAKQLRNRLNSYFRTSGVGPKQQVLMQKAVNIEFTITNNEAEALILENNLIKKHRPRYNIVLRDDKSYPYIEVDLNEDFPRLNFFRGAKKKSKHYFGPFPNAGSVRDTLKLLQKLFLIRQCEDSYFNNRSRPCLQYQIKRCTAPCVNYIESSEYIGDVKLAILFLEGKSQAVIDECVSRMEKASAEKNYEIAGRYRDQINSLRQISQTQYMDSQHGEADIIAGEVEAGFACVQVFFIRGGRNLGNKTFYPKVDQNDNNQDLLSSFISQYYLDKLAPREIIVSEEIYDLELIKEVLSKQAQHKVNISHKIKAKRGKWLELAVNNARYMLRTQMASQMGVLKRMEALVDELKLETSPERIECFDISHTSGDETVASCVVFGVEGAIKSDYRRFNISGITKADDCAALQQAVQRRYIRLIKSEAKLPDLIIIDGGKGQINAVHLVLKELQLDEIQLFGVSKGVDRKAGQEALCFYGQKHPVKLADDSPALHLIQQIRDEAHRFAISGHRNRRQKKHTRSVLEDIVGMGPKRRQLLLKQFGGLQQLEKAGVEDLASVKGISKDLAKKIYDVLHPGSISSNNN